eukprot:2583340-Amphidinium_carterae.2
MSKGGLWSCLLSMFSLASSGVGDRGAVQGLCKAVQQTHHGLLHGGLEGHSQSQIVTGGLPA